MIRAAALLLSAAVLAPLPAMAQTAPAPAAVSPARHALALELARLVNPEDKIMAGLDKIFGPALRTALLDDPAMKDMEDRYPGIADAMIAAMKPIILRYLRQQLPEMWEEIAGVLSEMSEDELRAVLAFYRTPTGARIIELMGDGLDMSPDALTDLMTNESNFDAVSNATHAAAAKSLEQLTPEQRADADRFARTPAGRRLTALTPRMIKVIADWSSKPASPEVEAELKAAITPVIERFTGLKLS